MVLLLGLFPGGDACTVDRPTTIGAPSPDTLKPGIHFSRASPTSFSVGLLWSSSPHRRTLSGGLPCLSATAQSWQMSATGISARREHSPGLQSPLLLRLARHVQHACQRQAFLRCLTVNWKNFWHSPSLCFSCPSMGHDQRDTLAGELPESFLVFGLVPES